MAGLLGKFERERKRHGAVYAVRRTLSYLFDPTRGRFSEDYSYVTSIPITAEGNAWNQKPLVDIPQGKLRINWIIPDMDIGSGGHTNIFRFAQHLEKKGHDQHFYVHGRSKFASAEAFRAAVRDHFFPINCGFSFGVENMRPADALIATSWQTAYPVYAAKNVARKFYLVQDFEPWFYPMSSTYVLSENTYRMNLIGIANGPWLGKKMKENYGMSGGHFNQGFDPNIYFTNDATERDPNLVIHYARPSTTRRAWELAIYALKQLKEQRPETKIVLYGADLAGIHVPFEHQSLGILPNEKLGALYRRATVALVCSLTNYSIIPHELMASGCVLVDLASETTEAIFTHGQNCLLAQPTATDIAQSLREVLDRPDYAKKLASQAHEYVQQWSWQKAGDAINDILWQAFKK
jgi:glycosyltransferase involved in cell wall biosynthesis